MSHEIYAFGSVCRGEASLTSDVDVLVVPFASESSQFPGNWSVYSPEIIREYYENGRLFAWHLHLESRCIFSLSGIPFLTSLGAPAPYSTMSADIDDLESLLLEALTELKKGTRNTVYELGIVYTALRDLAMSASWALLGAPCFSREAPYRLPVHFPLCASAYQQAMLARHSSTRGTLFSCNLDQVVADVIQAPLGQWVKSLRGAK